MATLTIELTEDEVTTTAAALAYCSTMCPDEDLAVRQRAIASRILARYVVGEAIERVAA